MAGKRFLNPIIKSFVCVAGMAIMGTLTYPVLRDGIERDSMFYARSLVFCGFAYLLLQTIKQILHGEKDHSALSSHPGNEANE